MENQVQPLDGWDARGENAAAAPVTSHAMSWPITTEGQTNRGAKAGAEALDRSSCELSPDHARSRMPDDG